MKRDATDNTRGQCFVLFLIGLVCLIPPVTPIGVIICIVSGLTLLFTPAMARVEDNLMTAAATGNDSRGPWGCVIGLAIVMLLIVLTVGGGAILTMAEMEVIR